MMIDRPEAQVPMRGGLRWLDAESNTRFGKTFVEITDEQRTALVDDIAYPRKARPEFSHGVAFFSRFRDAVATGFFTSKMGIADLQYMGNVPNPDLGRLPGHLLHAPRGDQGVSDESG